MNRVWISALLLILFPAQTRAELRVATTVPSLRSLVEAVGGKLVQTRSLARRTQNPHYVDGKPSDMLYLARVDVLLLIGLQLEKAWLLPLVRGSRNPKIQLGGSGYLDCSQFARLIDIPSNPDRAKGDLHPGGDPHYLSDPLNAQRVAIGIYKKFSALDPANRAHYKKNLVRFLKTLRARVTRWKALFGPFKGHPLIAYHKSVKYLAQFLGLEMLVHLEPKPGISPSPGHLLKVLQLSRQRKARVILQESYFPKKSARFVAARNGLQVVLFENGPAPNQGYIEHLDGLVRRLHQAYNKRAVK